MSAASQGPFTKAQPQRSSWRTCHCARSEPYYEGVTGEFERFGLGANWAQVKQTLRSLRNESVVITSGELGNSAAGISAAVFDDKRVIGSISIVIPVVDASPEVRTLLAPIVAKAGAEMTQKMTVLASSGS